MSASASAPLTESFGALNLPLGGKHGYRGVRGAQGSKKDGFQGYTPRKTHFTKVYKTAHEAAVNLALLKRDRENDNPDGDEDKKPRKTRSDKRFRCICIFDEAILDDSQKAERVRI